MSANIPGYLSISAASARLGVHRSTLYRHIERGDIPAFRTARNATLRLVAVEDIEAISRVTQEKGRKRKDWTGGNDWTDYMLEAAANRSGTGFVDVLGNDIWAEDQAPPLERTVQAAQPWEDEDDE